tara:strand:+ start:1109 stop:2368 length:1260 start_codon:yes stop_codon:yes gene_type:complete
MSIRTYYDPLHQGITLDSQKPEEAMIMELIDSSPFQRLRRIKQLGPASLTFHGAESSRFTHSLGVFEIARRAFTKLLAIDTGLKNFRFLLYGSALLHDIGHGPLSHTSEGIFGIKHEEWSARLIIEHPEIRGPLEKYSRGSSEKIANLLNGKNIPNKAIKSLVSSQLDCDRLDYLMRDSYSTGTKYGLLDLERILSAMTLSPDGDLAIHPKGLLAVEHYLVTRNLMYKSVYNHRLNEVSNWLLEQIFRRAKELGPQNIWTDRNMKTWLWYQEKLDIESFLSNDDSLMTYHLKRWSEDNVNYLSNLCKRFLNRDLFKAIDVEKLTFENQLKALSIARNLAKKKGHDPDLSCGIRKQKLHGYYPYKGGLRLWDGIHLEALEKESSLVNSLINPATSTWLIHDGEIHDQLQEEINLLEFENP